MARSPPSIHSELMPRSCRAATDISMAQLTMVALIIIRAPYSKLAQLGGTPIFIHSLAPMVTEVLPGWYREKTAFSMAQHLVLYHSVVLLLPMALFLESAPMGF